MNIRTTIRENPPLKEAIAGGTLEQPSVIIRTPEGNHDLMLGKKAYGDPNLRRLLVPLKNLVAMTLNQASPRFSGVVDGVSVIIDLTIQTAVAIEESQATVLQPIDGAEQLSRVLQQADSDDESVRQEKMRQIFGSSGQPEGILRFIASFDDNRAEETTSSLEIVLDETPLLGEIVQIGGGVFRWLDAKEPSLRFATSSINPTLMDELRERLAKS